MLAAVDTYTVAKFFHVLLTIVWIGGGVFLTLFAELTRRERDPRALVGVAKKAEWFGMRLFTPSSVVVFLLGLYLVHKGHWGWGHFWIIYALAAFAVSFLIGAGFLGPESGRLAKVIDAEGPESPAVAARINRILNVARVDLIILVTVVFTMVTKIGQ